MEKVKPFYDCQCQAKVLQSTAPTILIILLVIIRTQVHEDNKLFQAFDHFLATVIYLKTKIENMPSKHRLTCTIPVAVLTYAPLGTILTS